MLNTAYSEGFEAALTKYSASLPMKALGHQTLPTPKPDPTSSMPDLSKFKSLATNPASGLKQGWFAAFLGA